jgi:hypothetical protein
MAAARTVAIADVTIADAKIGYMFGQASGSAHNIERAIQNATQLERIGVFNTAEGRAMLEAHLRSVAIDQSSVVRTFSNEFGNFAVHESLFAGPAVSLNLILPGKYCLTADYASLPPYHAEGPR